MSNPNCDAAGQCVREACRCRQEFLEAEVKRLTPPFTCAYEAVHADTVGNCVDVFSRLEHQNTLLRAALTNWVKAYDDTGADNGPSMVEHDCAEAAKALLEGDFRR